MQSDFCGEEAQLTYSPVTRQPRDSGQSGGDIGQSLTKTLSVGDTWLSHEKFLLGCWRSAFWTGYGDWVHI